MQAFYPLKIQASAPKASRPGSTSIFPCPWRRQSACKPAKKSSGNCWIALNYTWYENSYLSSKPLKGQAKATKLLCRPPQNRLPKTNGAAAPTQVAPDPPVRENLIHDFLSAYEILGLGLDAAHFGDYAERDQTRREHVLEIETALGLRPLTRVLYRELAAWLLPTALATDHGPTLVTTLLEELRARRIVCPSLRAIERLAGSVRCVASSAHRCGPSNG